MRCTTPFIIQPADDLLAQHPGIKHLSAQLALKYAHNYAVTDKDLQAIGSLLWQSLDCNAAYDTACEQAGMQILPIIIRSDQASIQQLPWETLYHPVQYFLAKNHAYTLSRQIIDDKDQPAASPIEKGPLKILLFTSLTDDLSRLDVETEQAQVQEALMPWISKGLVQLKMPDDGRFSTFKNILKKDQPQLVFLSGHGKFYDKDLNAAQQQDDACFIFEAENSTRSEEIDATTLASAFIGCGVKCVVLSACQSGKSSSDSLSNGLMQQLAVKHIPHVIGMRESIMDTAGTRFAREFCDQIGQQARIDTALQAARLAISQPLKDTWHGSAADASHGQWCLPMLISQNPAAPLIDWQFPAQKPEFSRTTRKLQNIPIASQFIGRRKQMRDWFGQFQTPQQLLITSAGGQGKTALAGQLAQKLQPQGWTILAWSVRPENRWSDFLQYAESLLDETSRKTYTSHWLQNESDRANALLTSLARQSQQKLLVFFDNLESVQNPKTLELNEQHNPAWRDKLSQWRGNNPSHFAIWIKAASALAEQGISLIVTSRWKIPGWSADKHLSLEQCSYNDYLALARQKPELQQLDRDELREAHKTLHGNARALEFFAAAIQGTNNQQKEAFLQQLKQANAESQIDMALGFVFEQRKPDEKDLLKRLPSYHSPVAIEGVVKLSLTDPKLHNTRTLLENLLAVSLVEQTYADDMQCLEYQCSAQVRQWLEEQDFPPPGQPLLVAAAEYHAHLYQHERQTLQQAIILHQALQLAGEDLAADQLALNKIVGRLGSHGYHQRVLEQWLPRLCKSKDPKMRGDALSQTGKQLHHLGDYKTALKYLTRSLQIQQDIGDKSGEGTTLNNMAGIAHAQGDYETALECWILSLQIRQDIGDKSGEGTTLNNISQIYHAKGDYETALEYLTLSLQIQQDIGDKYGEGATLSNISQIYHAQGDYETALKYLTLSLQIRQDIGDKSGEGTTLNNISQIYHAQGDYETALKCLTLSLQIKRDIGDKSGEGITLNNISQIYDAQGDDETALKYLTRSLQIRQDIGDKSGEGTTLNNIGQIYQARGDYETALKYLTRSLQIQQGIGDKSGEGTTCSGLISSYQVMG